MFKVDYNRPTYAGSIIFLVCSALLFLGAIGIFVWLLVGASEVHSVKYILYASAFIAITLGILLYSIFVFRAPKTSTWILWCSMILGIATFIVGLSISDNPSLPDNPDTVSGEAVTSTI